MEKCGQCGAEPKANEQHPMVAIMSFDAAKEQDAAGVDKEKNWMAVPVCSACHQAPTLKGHFFPRNQMKRALGFAGSTDLG